MRNSTSSRSSNVEKRLADAKKFIRKYCRIYGQGISFNRDDGTFQSWVEIESKRDIEEVDWVEHNRNFGIRIPVQLAVSITNGQIINNLNDELFIELLIVGVAEMREDFKYKAIFFDLILEKLSISEKECFDIFKDLYLDRAISMMDKSFPVAQRAYDRWIEKGCIAKAKKEHLSSTFGDKFLSELLTGLNSFKNAYIAQETDIQFYILNKMYGRFQTKEFISNKAKKNAVDSWPYWVKSEYYSICEKLLDRDIGVCESFKLRFDEHTMKITGEIFGNTGKRLEFYTIFAGGYNIQRLHMRTIVHVY